jgi:hypothetical protein
MSTNSPPHLRLRSLHERLTVALSTSAERSALVQLVGEAPGDAIRAVAAVVMNSADLRTAAAGFSQRRAADRANRQAASAAGVAAAREQHETASRELVVVSSRQRVLLDGAVWVEQAEATVRSDQGALHEAEALLEIRRREHAAADLQMAQILQQRQALEEAINHADRHREDANEPGMNERGLRRELEAAGRAVHEATVAHEEAKGRLADRQAVAIGARAVLVLAPPVVAPTPDHAERTEDPALAAVVNALVALRSVSAGFEDVDPHATALAEAWGNLEADLAELPAADLAPSEAELATARARVAAVEAEFGEIERAARANTLSAADRAALDAAHRALLEAEDGVGRRWGAAARGTRVTEARAAEQALLAHHGFPAYIDVVMSGGRSRVFDPRHAGLDRERQSAAAALGALVVAAEGSPERQHLASERQRLHAMVVELLGVDPRDRVPELLKAHRQVPRSLQVDLTEALAEAGIRPAGIDLESAATAYVESRGVMVGEGGVTDATARSVEARGQIPGAADDQRDEAYEVDLRSAEWEVDRLAEELQLAQGSVAAVESELSQRATRDAVRADEAEALADMRSQIDGATGSLVVAQQAAQCEMDRTAEGCASAEGNLEAAELMVRGTARKVRQLAEELPGADRFAGDPLEDLAGLVGRLKDQATSLDPARSQAETDVAATARRLAEARAAALVAETVVDEGVSEDLVAGLETVLQAADPDRLVVLDEPFGDLAVATTGALLRTLLHASEDRPIVVLSEDPNILAWAIELPAPAGLAIPAAVLRRDLEHTVAIVAPVAAAPLAAAPVVVAPVAAALVAPVPVPVPVPAAPMATTRRWAGQRSPLIPSE